MRTAWLWESARSLRPSRIQGFLPTAQNDEQINNCNRRSFDSDAQNARVSAQDDTSNFAA
jgi:hypothetical protein